MKRFAMMPLELFKTDLSGRAWRVLGVLIAHANQEGACWPTDRLISDATGIREDNIRGILLSLAQSGLIARSIENHKRVIRLNLCGSEGVKNDPPRGSNSAPYGGQKQPPSVSGGGQIQPGVKFDPQEGVKNDPPRGSNSAPYGGSKTTHGGVKFDPPIRTDQEQTKEELKAGIAPAREHAHAREQGAGLAAAPDRPIPDSGDPEPAGMTPGCAPPPTPGAELGAKIDRLGGEYLDGARAEVPVPRVPPGLLEEITRDCQRDGLGFWIERLLAGGCPEGWIAPLFRSFWCRRGSNLPRTYRPLEMRFRDWQRAGGPLREHLAERDLKELQEAELLAAEARQREEFFKAKGA